MDKPIEADPNKDPGKEPESQDNSPSSNDSPAEKTSFNIEEILRERNRIDKLIQDEFKKETTILFTDICGYTQYMDTMADINGLTKLQRHNDIVLPLVEKHAGKLIKMIGDAVMATFAKPSDAVNASIAIQKSLYQHNQKQNEAEKIHVKIGINTGDVIEDKSDIFGDAVNVAARIQSQAGKDQTLISRSVYEKISDNDDIICRMHGTATVKGKAQPIELFEIFWGQEYGVMAPGKVRAGKAGDKTRSASPVKVIQIELTRENNHLKIGAHEQHGDKISTIRQYEEISITLDKIEERCHEIIETLNHANSKGSLAREALIKLRGIGQAFRDELFTADVKEKLKKTKANHLILNLDDGLVHIPWELLHDGRQFLCQQFNMGRLVKTRQTVIETAERSLGQPLKMMILANPSGDLPGAYQEGLELLNFTDQDKDLVKASLRSDSITRDFVKKKIKNFDFVHFAGHAEYNRENPGKSGWQLTDGTINAEEIMGIADKQSMPALVFSNSCQSGGAEKWEITENSQNEIFGLANAFILSGVKHCVGTFWEILDEPSRYFALEFYRHLFSGITVGEALKNARFSLIDKYGEESIVWASYLLYGDPTFNYLDQIREIAVAEEAKQPVLTRETRSGSGQALATIPQKMGIPQKWRRTVIAAVIAACVAAVFFWYSGYVKSTIVKYEQSALAYYSQGNFEDALNTCKILADKSAGNRLAYLIEADIYLRTGKMPEAETTYRKALGASKGTDQQKAAALMGLGRIASLNKQTDVSIDYYQQATRADPSSQAGYLSQAILMDNSGNSAQALKILDRARQISPDNRSVNVIANEISKRVSLIGDKEKQDRIDQMVKELIETMNDPPRALPSDGWTSGPLTLWVMDFKVQGYSLQEGEERLIVSEITDQMLQHSRVQIVERALLDKLLGELKLGSSQLIDRRTALSLGNILAAKLLLSGQIVYAGPETQVSMRLIETETGRITAAVNESFGSAVPASVLTDKLSENLLNKLKKLYPLQGKITEVKPGEVMINIGKNVGVEPEQIFSAANGDIVLKVIAIEQEKSLAKIEKGDTEVIEGQRIAAKLL